MENMLTLFKITKRSLEHLIMNPKFPQPIKLGPKVRRWRKAEIMEFIDKRGIV